MPSHIRCWPQRQRYIAKDGAEYLLSSPYLLEFPALHVHGRSIDALVIGSLQGSWRELHAVAEDRDNSVFPRSRRGVRR